MRVPASVFVVQTAPSCTFKPLLPAKEVRARLPFLAQVLGVPPEIGTRHTVARLESAM